ncbi:MAG: cation/H(+) antiporter [Cytophagales bacterium]|nr:MAG: cation/H(+) antiporter [Cytophagales bacterium]
MKKSIVFYSIVVVFFFGVLLFFIREGQLLENDNPTKKVTLTNTDTYNTSVDLVQIFSESFHQNSHHPLATLILQIISIIVVARIFSLLMGKIGQPTVIGEIIAGIVIGKSVLGTFFPEFSNFLFPAESLPALQFLSQIGLILFMFIIGMELDVNVLRQKMQEAVVISHASIVIPFALGVILSYFIYTTYAPPHVAFLSFSLFMGIAMSITAFPVLARIIQERGLTKTRLGSIVITCAAIDDVTAWCLLAVVVAIVKAGNATSALFTILFSIVYVVIMLYVLRPFLLRVSKVYASKETLNKNVVAFFFIVLLSSAYIAELIGIHALFGAFLAGAVIPNDLRFKEILTGKIEDVSLVLLLPLFFVFTGLRTQIGLLQDFSLLLTCGAIIITAIIGKLAGAALTAKLVGLSWRDSLTIGVFMNTRGLMELIILNIGYDLGVLSTEIFSMMVLMALATTFMTSPCLDFINYFFDKYHHISLIQNKKNDHAILISFGLPQMGSKLLELVSQFTYKVSKKVDITALHLTPSTQLSQIDALTFEEEAFIPIRETALLMGLKIETKYKVSEDVGKEVALTANRGTYDMLVVGSAKSLFSKDKLGGTVRNIVSNTKCAVAVFIDKDFHIANQIVLFLETQSDIELLQLVRSFLDNVTYLIRIVYEGELYAEVAKFLTNPTLPNKSIAMIQKENFHTSVLEDIDLAIMSINYWQKIDEEEVDWAEKLPSVLIVKGKDL